MTLHVYRLGLSNGNLARMETFVTGKKRVGHPIVPAIWTRLGRPELPVIGLGSDRLSNMPQEDRNMPDLGCVNFPRSLSLRLQRLGI